MSNDDNSKDKSIENNVVSEISGKYGIDISKDPLINGIIVDLNFRIDKFAEDSKTLVEHILELAKRLDESNACQRDQICKNIKEILKDKIKQGKITERWIEECLPKEYKRQYDHVKQKQVKKNNSESELTSLLKENDLEKREILVTTDGSQHNDNNSYLEKAIQPQPFLNNFGAPEDIDQKPSKNNIEKVDDTIEDCNSCILLKERINDLEEIIRKNNSIETVYNLQKLELKVSKKWENVFVAQFEKCKDHIIIVIDRKTKTIEFLRQDVVSDNVVEASDNSISHILKNNNNSDHYNATADDNDTLQRGEDFYE